MAKKQEPREKVICGPPLRQLPLETVMLRQTLVHDLLMAGLVLSAAGGLADAADRATLAGSKPNIILIMPDDMGWGDMAAHGNPLIKTPNLDQLYAESTRFTDFHVSPTCAPTRSALDERPA